MDRRDFFKIAAATSATATLASCGNPEHQLIRFIPEDTFIQGIAQWKPSICPLCPSGCGTLVRVMQGEAEVFRKGQLGLIKMGLAKKLEGNPAHPVSQGKLCVRGQAALQVTYHPDRLASPMKRSGERGSGQFQPITWDEAMADLVSHMDALAAAGDQKSLAFLTRPIRGQRHSLISQFVNRFGAPAPVEFEVFGEQVLRRANARSFGMDQLPTLDLANTRFVLSFGADFLGTWNSVVAQNVGYGEMRQGKPGNRGKFVQIEPRMTQTGANADQWIPANPGTEGILALGIAHEMLKNGVKPGPASARAGAQIEGWSGGLADYTPEAVAKRTGVSAAQIQKLAREFAENKPAVALIAGAPLAHTNGLFNAIAVNALNALAGSVGEPGGILFTPQPEMAADPKSKDTAAPQPFDKFAAELLSAAHPAQLLLLHDANPVFGAPPAWRAKDALSKVPYIVSFGSFIDETSILADLILPDHSFLESWVDHVPEAGSPVAVASVAAPAMKPLHETRAMADVLLETGRKLKQPLSPPIPYMTYQDMLKAAFETLPKPKPSGKPGEEAPDLWTTAQAQGGWFGEAPAEAKPIAGSGSADKAVAAADPQFDGEVAQYPFHFLPFSSQQFLDGSLAHLPWLQELPDVLTTAMWSTWVEINPQTANGFGIRQGDLVEVTSAHGLLKAPAILSPGIAPNIIAMPVGQGHENFTRYASKRGANPLGILAALTEPETGALAWAATRVRIAKTDGDGKLILFAGGIRENQIEHR